MMGSQDNSVAIAELTVIAKQTTKDLDRVINHLDQAPISRTIALEKRMAKVELRLPNAISKSVIMWGTVIVLSSTGAFLTLAYKEITLYNKNLTALIHRIDTKVEVIDTVCKTHDRLIHKLEEKNEK